jgi:hypothetical protein
MTRSLTLDPIADVASLVGDHTVVAFDVGPDERPYIVCTADSSDYRIQNAAGASFPKVVPDIPRDYRVVCLDGGEPTLDVLIEGVKLNVHAVQPLGGGILLVCSRTFRRSRNDFDLNGHIYDRLGGYRRSLLLGDGIQDVQTTVSETIWTSYFDEGIFGNLGWREPIGASGLIAWTSAGERSYEFSPPDGLQEMADCYALNVESDDDAWCYYYTDFALVHIRDRSVASHWKMPLEGSSCFAVAGNHALFNGGYENRDLYSVFRLDSPEPVLLVQLTLNLQNQRGVERAVGRRNYIWLLAGTQIYRLSVESALEVIRRR